MSRYWNINQILPYQRCFNFINGSRSIGKTYTTQKFVLDRCIKRDLEFVYLVRTQDEKKQGILEKAFEKVTLKEFPSYEFSYDIDTMYVKDSECRTLVGHCIALSESQKIKKRSFPGVKYLIFDEYMLESGGASRYVNGWKEPDLFLSIYHTIDREEDRVICFCLGNNTSFYNPYHMHPAFNIPDTKPGEIFTSENVLFQWAEKSPELREEKNKSKFVKMIDGTKYGEYASMGRYTEDSRTFIEERSENAKHMFYFEYMGAKYGVWYDSKIGRIFIDYKYDPSCKIAYALTLADHSENTTLTSNKKIYLLRWLAENFKLGNVRYINMAIKKMAEGAIQLLL